MTQSRLLHELKKLSPQERLEIIEETVRLLQEDLRKSEPTSLDETTQQLAQAAQALLKDYEEDRELTCFTALDGEAFHE